MSGFLLLPSPAITHVIYFSTPVSKENIVKCKNYHELQLLFVIVWNPNVKQTRQIIWSVRLVLKKTNDTFSSVIVQRHVPLEYLLLWQNGTLCHIGSVMILNDTWKPTAKHLDDRFDSRLMIWTSRCWIWDKHKLETLNLSGSFQAQPKQHQLHQNWRASKIFTTWGAETGFTWTLKYKWIWLDSARLSLPSTFQHTQSSVTIWTKNKWCFCLLYCIWI